MEPPLVLLLLVCFPMFAQCQQRGVNVNSIFDFIMQNTRDNLMWMSNFTTIPIPDLETEIVFGFEPVNLKATQGTLTDMTTMHRIGDVSMTTQGNVATFYASVGLDVMQVVFRHYALKAGLTGLLRWSGNKLALDVKKNSMDAVLIARFDGLSCNIKMTDIKFQEFSDVQVDIEGFSIFNPIGSKIAETIIQFFNNLIKGIAEDYAKMMVNDAVRNTEICSQIFGQAIGGIVGLNNAG